VWKINVRENQSCNQEWTIQRHWQYWTYDTEQRETNKNTTHKAKQMSNPDLIKTGTECNHVLSNGTYKIPAT